jgi:amidase
MTPLEIGSDIGGSIRVPAAYCGVYGHRPSTTAVPRAGAYPMSEFNNPAFAMAVQGPLARSATDLELLFDVIARPVPGEDVAWRLDLPTARPERLRDFRVAVMPPLPWVTASTEMIAKVDELAAFLSHNGTTVGEAMPGFDLDGYFHDYLALLMVDSSLSQSREEREAAAESLATNDPVFSGQSQGFVLDAAEHLRLMFRREAAANVWRRFFTDWDVLIAPMTLDAAFHHTEGETRTRTLVVDGNEVPYMMNIAYPMWAIFTGQPSTAFPAGLGAAGLPLGLQAIGPYLEDRTTLRFAQLLEAEWQAFQPPPGY